jgi:hypothetical protein
MWTTVFSIISKFGKDIVPIIKQLWYFIVIGLLILYAGVLKYELLQEENKYLLLEKKLSDIYLQLQIAKSELTSAQAKADYIISENKKRYEADMKNLKASIKKDMSNATNKCDAAIDILRRNL